MKAITTEVIIPLGEHKTIYSAQRIYIRVQDLAAGPFLAIEGVDDEPEGEGEWFRHSLYLCTEKDINEFAGICKKVLREANG